VALLSKTRLKPHQRFITNYSVYRTHRFSGLKGGTAIEAIEGILNNHVELPPLVSIEATGIYLPIGNSEVLLAAVYKSLGRAWNDPDVIDLFKL
jgi:hypothetical protein